MANIRSQYKAAQMTTACHVMPDQIAAAHPRWINTNGRADGYMMSSCSSSTSVLRDMFIIFGSLGYCGHMPGLLRNGHRSVARLTSRISGRISKRNPAAGEPDGGVPN